jgi:SpoVK/Ycf46/Vps4 family AAA+-type ATPase
MNIYFVEKIIDLMLHNQTKTVIDLLKDEMQKMEAKDQKVYASRLRNLISRIPASKYTAQGSSLNELSGAKNDELFRLIDSSITMEDIALDEAIRQPIGRLLTEWEKADQLKKHGLYPVNRVLVYGPPGTGKTKLAYAIANKLDLPLVIVRLDELISSYLGKTGKNIREIFDLAKRKNVVLFFDEIDTIAKHRDDNHELGELKRVVTVLLQNLDDLSNDSIIIAATNHEHLLDKALWRRFTLRINLPVPSDKTRERMFEMFLTNRVVESGKVDLSLLSRLTTGWTGSAIEELCMEAKREAALTDADIDEIFILKRVFSFATFRKATSKSKENKKALYDACKVLHREQLSLAKISEISGIAYTTLRDNIGE